MVRYDLPAMIEYVVNQTGQSQIYYVGHSQGTLIAFTGFSNNLQLAARIKAFYALAPVVKVGYIKGLTHYIAYLTPEIRVETLPLDVTTLKHAFLGLVRYIWIPRLSTVNRISQTLRRNILRH